MAGPTDPFDVTRPQLPDNAGELTQTLRAMKEVLVDLRDRVVLLEELADVNLGDMVGAMFPWGANDTAPPRGFLFCHGQAVSRDEYARLFTKIGVVWGSGDGTTTFNLPDFRGRTSRGIDHGTGRDHEVGRLVGSYQEDTVQNITGSVIGIRLPFSYDYEQNGALKLTRKAAHGARLTSSGAHSSYDLSFDNADSPGSRTSDETVMKNAGSNWIIKY